MLGFCTIYVVGVDCNSNLYSYDYFKDYIYMIIYVYILSLVFYHQKLYMYRFILQNETHIYGVFFFGRVSCECT